MLIDYYESVLGREFERGSQIRGQSLQLMHMNLTILSLIGAGVLLAVQLSVGDPGVGLSAPIARFIAVGGAAFFVSLCMQLPVQFARRIHELPHDRATLDRQYHKDLETVLESYAESLHRVVASFKRPNRVRITLYSVGLGLFILGLLDGLVEATIWSFNH